MEAIFSAVQGSRGPYKLLAAMQERHVRAFLQENWEQIAAKNKPFSTDIDHIDYDVPTCQLFILWAWYKVGAGVM